ncbi:hormogonium polysaccharide secretion pseudopilin HpsC [Spirulina subsalsa FACHB-351]|uniref:Hormogonium polysaccharide secretion pseudopilin HpsC n=1 Tax=Spirulina subsalsa FACHB-351 TaxID=234711 RepID=A0ABT3L9T1_9CYAN|nr:hormogonium polysaccharide secretion pseudopilin HpsC [Spirulina subsalsa]MCW6037869.1 hormogonium polysaccharide secretion pseudopilin HpsC [Spirulina subsalsa FACHB-351]
MDSLHLLLKTLLKTPPTQGKNSGFTLIELLVSILIAALVITPLLGLAVNLINTDRQEMARATTEQDIQMAVDYIARDLQQAVYIYDAVALTRNHNEQGSISGIRDQIPPVSAAPGCNNTDMNCVPVLAFWKRRPVRNAIPIDRRLNQQGTNCLTANNAAQQCNDTFVYSLVVYYLIRNTGNNPSVWSQASRIGRFELHDGVYDPFPRVNASRHLPEERSVLPPSTGFQLFNLNQPGTDLASKMNRWTKGQGTFGPGEQVQILVDYVDHSPSTGDNAAPAEACPTDTGWTTSPVPGNVPNGFPTNSFYACINSASNTARVHIRGNALARIRNIGRSEYRASLSAYFPTTRTQVTARGRLVQQQR